MNCNPISVVGAKARAHPNVCPLGGQAHSMRFAAVVVFVFDPGNLEHPDEARTRVVVTPTTIQAVIRW